MSGYDPPQYAVMLQQREPQGGGAREDAAPLLKPPQDYRLTWRDESVRADQALHIWRPGPWPGYHIPCSPSFLFAGNMPVFVVCVYSGITWRGHDFPFHGC